MTTNTSNPSPSAQANVNASPNANPMSQPQTTSTQNPPLITLELIAQRKAQKLEEVRKAKVQMSETLHQLFAPVENKGGMEGIMQHVNTGIAVYDGVRTGIKIMQRIRGFFLKTRRR